MRTCLISTAQTTNLNLDTELIHSELRDLSEETLEKYDKKGTIDANFYINKKGKLRGIVLETEENKEEGIEREPILSLALTGEENTTDNISLTVNNILNSNLFFTRELNTSDNTLSSRCTAEKTDGSYSKTIEDIFAYDASSKSLKYSLDSTSGQNVNFKLELNGQFDSIDKNGYTFNIDD